MSGIKLLVFGGTGATGSQVVTQSLESEKVTKLRLFLRNPSKLSEKVRGNAKIEIVTGDIQNSKEVIGATRDIDAIISVVKGPLYGVYPSNIIRNFCEALLRGCEEHGVKRLVFQAGSFSEKDRTERLDMMTRFVRFLISNVFTCGTTNFMKIVQDNSAALELLGQNTSDELWWIAPRPGALSKGAKGDLKLVHSQLPQRSSITFGDMAAFNLEAATGIIQCEKGLAPFLKYKR